MYSQLLEHRMKSVNSSITGLTKSAEIFKAALEKSGLQVDLSVFQTGRGGTEHYGPSYIQIAVSDANGMRLADAKVHSGGFGEIVTWRGIKREILDKIMKEAS